MKRHYAEAGKNEASDESSHSYNWKHWFGNRRIGENHDMRLMMKLAKVPEKKPVSILHVLKGMDRGGIETWLMHVVKHIDRERFRFDFLTHTTIKCAYDDELKKLGCRIIPCLEPHQPWKYAWNFKKLLREYGPYDVVHSHVHHFSGFVCWLARQAGIKSVVAHSHNDTTITEVDVGIARRMYLHMMKWLIQKNAHHGFACSRQAAHSLFGRMWESDPRWSLLYFGIDFKPFEGDIEGRRIREELGIPEDALVIGHVGRFVNQKNHHFLLEIIAAAAQSHSVCYALLIGDGPLRSVIEEKAQRLGIEKRVIFAGLRSDIPRVMRGAMDVFVMPSFYEGLGIVLIEAQAAGLPCVIAEVIPDEADVVTDLITRLSLTDDPQKWARHILLAEKNKEVIRQNASLEKMKNSPFNISVCVRDLEEFYGSECV